MRKAIKIDVFLSCEDSSQPLIAFLKNCGFADTFLLSVCLTPKYAIVLDSVLPTINRSDGFANNLYQGSGPSLLKLRGSNYTLSWFPRY